MNKKSVMIFVSISLLILSSYVVFGAGPAGDFPMPGIPDLTASLNGLANAINAALAFIIQVFKLDFLKGDTQFEKLYALLRFCFWVCSFAIFYQLAKITPVVKDGRLPLLFSLIISIMVTIFMPAKFLALFVEEYTAVIAIFLLFSLPAVAIWVYIRRVRSITATSGNLNRWDYILFAIASFVLYYMMATINMSMAELVGAA
jgi:hypothetical protein